MLHADGGNLRYTIELSIVLFWVNLFGNLLSLTFHSFFWCWGVGVRQCVEILIVHGSDRKKPYKFGRTPIQIAVEEKHPKVVELLLSVDDGMSQERSLQEIMQERWDEREAARLDAEKREQELINKSLKHSKTCTLS